MARGSLMVALAVALLAGVPLVMAPVQAEEAGNEPTAQVEEVEAAGALMSPAAIEDGMPGQLTAPEPEWMGAAGPGGTNPCAAGETFCCLDEWQGPDGCGICGEGTRNALCTTSPSCDSGTATTSFFCVDKDSFCFQ